MTDNSTHSFGDGHDHGPCPTCGHHWKPCPDGDRVVTDCPNCDGVGCFPDPNVGVADCRDCDGRGEVMDDDCVMICKTCDGSGKREFHVPTTKPPTWGLTSCPDCKGTGTAAAPAVTDEMVEAFWQASPTEWRFDNDRLHSVLAAVLAAAPAVEGLVWCDSLEDAVRDHHTDGGVESHRAWLKRPCEATHRTLHLGPEVTPDRQPPDPSDPE